MSRTQATVEFNGVSRGAVAAARQTREAISGVGTQARHTEQDLGKLSRGALAGSGIFRGLGRSVAFASAGFLAAAREERRDPRTVRLGREPGTVSNALTPLRKMLGDAVEWGYLTSNPAAGVKRPRVEREEMQVLSADEVRKLLDGADQKGKPHVRAEARTLVLCAVATGMRRGEVLGLRWGDVDWVGRRVWVRCSVSGRGVVSSPKSKGSTRAIAMPASLASALRLHRMASPFKAEGDYVFASSTGTPLEPRNVVRREFEPALKRAGLPRIRFHDLRHTFASLLIAQGEHPKLIAEQLGHASVQITLDRYGHLMPQSYDHAGDRLEAALFGGDRVSVAGNHGS